jgi:hypothetical protein
MGAVDTPSLSPLYGSCKTSQAGLEKGIIRISARNYESGNSGGPVFYMQNGKLTETEFRCLKPITLSDYEYIIVDLPPLMPVSDAAILSKYIDGFIIVVRHEKSEFAKIQETLHQLEFSGAKVLGFVYNGKALENHYRKSNKYYYYYDYYKKKK